MHKQSRLLNQIWLQRHPAIRGLADGWHAAGASTCIHAQHTKPMRSPATLAAACAQPVQAATLPPARACAAAAAAGAACIILASVLCQPQLAQALQVHQVAQLQAVQGPAAITSSRGHAQAGQMRVVRQAAQVRAAATATGSTAARICSMSATWLHHARGQRQLPCMTG